MEIYLKSFLPLGVLPGEGLGVPRPVAGPSAGFTGLEDVGKLRLPTLGTQ